VLEDFPSHYLKRLSEDSSNKSLKLTLLKTANKKSNEQVDHLILDIKLHDSKSLSKYGRKLLQFITQVREERRLHD
jgi:hypothetical protein